MLLNYLKIALRYLLRRKSFSLINILGLAVGIAVCTVIYLYVSYEKSYDTFNKNANHIYRLENVRYYKSGTDNSAGCIALLGPTLKEEMPEVLDFVRVRKISMLVTAHNHYWNEKNIFWADSSILTMFSFPLISGNAGKALVERYSAVITESMAHKYFGSQNVIGETIQVGGTDFRITGIAKDVPDNSHIKFDILLSFNTQLTEGFCWGCNNNNTYIQVKPGTNKSELEAKLPLIVSKLHNRQKDGFDRAYHLQPLLDIHLYSNVRFEHEENGNANTVNLLSLIAAIILMIAWINYINLSTARSIERAKEVGLRKVVGASFKSLVRQFLLESFIIHLIAVFISILMVQLTLPSWSAMIGMPDSFSLWNNTRLIVFLLALIIVSPIVAGLYPAFVLSSYSPVSILRGSFKNSVRGILLRKGLIIFQFTISIMLIAVIIVFNQQISFMRNNYLGFDIKHKLVVNVPAFIQRGQDRVKSYDAFLHELKNQSLIEDAAFSSVLPGMENGDVSGGVRQSVQTQEQGKQVYFVYVTQNYLKFFNIDLVCGRNFYESEINGLYQRDNGTRGLILNENAVRALGFDSPNKALGASIIHDEVKIGNVVGVIKDYHQQSLDKEIEPTIIEGATRGNYFIFDINMENVPRIIEGIKISFTTTFPGNPFEYNFLDEFFDRQYRADIKTAEIFGVFTFLSIFISCLGLVGLSSLMILHRTKEIGVRKVLGASVQLILVLLSKEFVRWILISNIIAWPIAYYFINKWLQDFAYRIEISLWVFVLSGGIVLIIALITVSFQTVKAAIVNPVESLRYE